MSDTVVKHNGLIEAKFKTPALTKAHGRVLAYLVSKVHSKADDEFHHVTLIPEEYKEITGNSSYNVKQVEWDLDELTDLKCVIRTKTTTEFCHLIDYARYDHVTGEITMRLGEEMKPYLLQLHSNYTMYYLEEFLQLRSKHSQRIYEIFQKEKNQKNFVVLDYPLEEFKEMLGLVEYKNKGKDVVTKYSRWVDFEKRVLVGARDELCEIGILFEYEPVIKKRKTVGVKLHFNPTADSLEDQTYEEFCLLKSFPIKAIEKIDISRCRSRFEIEQAITQSLKDGDYKAVSALNPKTRSERLKLMKQKVRTEQIKGDLTEGQKELF